MRRDEEKPFLEHLEELSLVLKRCFIAVLVCSVVALLPANLIPWLPLLPSNASAGNANGANALSGLPYVPLVSAVLQKVERDLLPPQVRLMAYTWTDVLWAYIVLSLSMGFVLALPYIIYQFYKFVEPGLYEHEKKMAVKYMFLFFGLFVLGCIFCYVVLLPWSFQILLYMIIITGVEPLVSFMDFINFVAILMIMMGLAFAAPAVIMFFVDIGVLDPAVLEQYWRHIIVAVLFFAAVITPGTAGFQMMIVSAPLLVLFWATKVYAKRKQKKASKLAGSGAEAGTQQFSQQ